MFFIGGSMYRIIPTDKIMKKIQYFIPKSKKKRIQKKAAKLYIKLVPDKETVIMDHCNRIIYAHPDITDKLKETWLCLDC
jgi:hypothetical protein